MDLRYLVDQVLSDHQRLAHVEYVKDSSTPSCWPSNRQDEEEL
jgi:hypothetical protein